MLQMIHKHVSYSFWVVFDWLVCLWAVFMFSKIVSKSFPEIRVASNFQRSYVDAHVCENSYWYFERDCFFPNRKGVV